MKMRMKINLVKVISKLLTLPSLAEMRKGEVKIKINLLIVTDGTPLPPRLSNFPVPSLSLGSPLPLKKIVDY